MSLLDHLSGPLPPAEPPIPDYANSITFPPKPPDGIPDAAPCPECGCGLFWTDAYDGLHCGICNPPPVAALAVRRLFVRSNPEFKEPRPPFEWLDWDWMLEYPEVWCSVEVAG